MERLESACRSSRHQAQSSRTKVTCMLTWYAVTLPSWSLTCCSLIQAEVTPRRVLVARSSPCRMASSKLCSEVAEISVTRATDIAGQIQVVVATPRRRGLRWVCGDDVRIGRGEACYARQAGQGWRGGRTGG